LIDYHYKLRPKISFFALGLHVHPVHPPSLRLRILCIKIHRRGLVGAQVGDTAYMQTKCYNAVYSHWEKFP